MDMPHIIMDLVSPCSEFAIFGSVFIVPIHPTKVNLSKQLLQCGMLQFNTNKKFVKSFSKKMFHFFSEGKPEKRIRTSQDPAAAGEDFSGSCIRIAETLPAGLLSPLPFELLDLHLGAQ